MSKITILKRNIVNNGDSYLEGIGALIAAILTGIGIIPTQVVDSFICGIFVIIAWSLLRNRWASDRSYKEIKDIKEKIPAVTSVDFYYTQEGAERHLIDYVTEQKNRGTAVMKAYLLQCSISAGSMARRLIENDVDVTIFILDEVVASAMGSKHQNSAITKSIDSLITDLIDPSEASKLKIYKYKTPCSIYGIAFDDSILCMSWYSYLAHDRNNDWMLPRECRDDKLIIRGHDRAAIIIRSDHPHFESLKDTFDKQVKNYQDNSILYPTGFTTT